MDLTDGCGCLFSIFGAAWEALWENIFVRFPWVRVVVYFLFAVLAALALYQIAIHLK